MPCPNGDLRRIASAARSACNRAIVRDLEASPNCRTSNRARPAASLIAGGATCQHADPSAASQQVRYSPHAVLGRCASHNLFEIGASVRR